MQVFTGSTSIAFCESHLAKARLPQTTWIQFGDTAFLIAPAPQWQSIAQAAQPLAAVKQNPQPSQLENLYLVVQKGRLFQQEHPDVPVLLDRGRYLVVELEAEQAKAWDKGEEPCYAIRSLQDYSVVFQRRPQPASRLQPATELQDLVAQVAQLQVEETLQKLVSFPTRYSTSASYTAAADWMQQRLAALGYNTKIEPIRVGTGTSQNVIAEKLGNGAENTKELVIVTAHLDSINHRNGALATAPGADDNGTGSAGVIEIARVLQNYSHQHDLRLILFGGEEQGLFGSRQYVNQLDAAERSRIKAIVNMDMIGVLNTETPTVMLEGAVISQAVIDALAAAAERYTILSVQTSLNPFASDHVPFIDAGLPAVLTIEGADSANDAVHSANDTLDRINYQLMLDILRMNVACVAGLLNSTQTGAPL